MAPLAADPRQLVVVLNTARRRALYQLANEITGYMRSQLETAGEPSASGIPQGASSSRQESTDAPLFVPVGAPKSSEVDAAAATPPSAAVVQLRKAALAHYDQWRKEFLSKLKEIASAQEDNKVLEERKKRSERIAQAKPDATKGPEADSLIDFGDAPSEQKSVVKADDFHSLQQFYHPTPTRLTTVALQDRKETLSCLLILMLSTGNYSAYSRAFAVYLTSSLELPLSVLTTEETEIAVSLVETSAAAEKQMSADSEAEKRKQEGQTSRYWKVGLASVAGAAVIGITGGLAAPIVAGAVGGLMGSVGLGGVASFLGIFWMNGALVGTLFGAFGAKMTGAMMDQYAREVEDFRFLPLKDEPEGEDSKKQNKDARRLRVTIGVNGWLVSKDDVTKPWRVLSDESEVFALRFEMASLIELGNSLDGLVTSYAWSYAKSEIIKRTILASASAVLWPAYLLKTASNIDNPFNRARNRSEKAGKILADALINKVQGERPVTLVGYSLGARVIYTCLRSLAERKAFGLVDTVVFIGAPIPSNRSHWQIMRTVVSGKLFNVHSENDYILAFMYRATSIQLGIAGLQAIDNIPGVENLNLSDEVRGHLRYPDLIAQILARCGFPDVKGGEGPIEKEQDDVAIQEQGGKTGNPMGSLIELDDLPSERPPKLPKRPSVTGPSRSQTRNVVTRTASESLSQELDPLSSLSLESNAVKPLSRPPRKPQELGESMSEKSLPSDAKRKSEYSLARKSTNQFESKSKAPAPAEPTAANATAKATPTTPAAIQSSYDGHRHTGEDSDDDGGGIKMVDNDEDMTSYDEPLIVED